MRFDKAIALLDEVNMEDPNKESFEGKEYPKEYLYGIRMSERLDIFYSDAPVALKLAARCQHIRRWEIPRDTYPMDRVGYLKWRNDLKKLHSDVASEILEKVGYEKELIEQVSFLLLKKQLKKNELTQALEDVICLVFLDFYFDEFSTKYDEEKLIDIVQKTWKKMSDKGHDAALKLSYTDTSLALIPKAWS